MKKFLKKALNVFLPVAILAGGALGLGGMVNSRTRPQTATAERQIPAVRTLTVRQEKVVLSVETQGTVSPYIEGIVTSEVAGRVIEVSDKFTTGGFFEKDEVLMKIDPRDYELAVVRAKAQVARAQAMLERERAESRVAEKEWKEIGDGPASSLALRKPQLASAVADLEAAQAALKSANINLNRTQIRAAYNGCVRKKMADVGQYVAFGTPVAQVFATDYAEVRLPLTDVQLSQLDKKSIYGNVKADTMSPGVTLSAKVGGELQAWTGVIDRVEGHVDSRSRMTYVIARIFDPYGREKECCHPLSVGLFVKAKIEGRTINEAVVLPRGAIKGNCRVMVVDENNCLEFRDVNIVRAGARNVIVNSGLETGERVCISTLDVAVDGMEVSTAGGNNMSSALAGN